MCLLLDTGCTIQFAHWLASFFSRATGRTRNSPIAGGMYITRLARNLGVFAQPAVEAGLTVVPEAARIPFGIATLHTMRMLTPDRRRLLGQIDPAVVQEEEMDADAAEAAAQAQDEPHIPSPPHPTTSAAQASTSQPSTSRPSTSDTSIPHLELIHGVVHYMAQIGDGVSLIAQRQGIDFTLPPPPVIPIPSSIPTPSPIIPVTTIVDTPIIPATTTNSPTIPIITTATTITTTSTTTAVPEPPPPASRAPHTQLLLTYSRKRWKRDSSSSLQPPRDPPAPS